MRAGFQPIDQRLSRAFVQAWDGDLVRREDNPRGHGEVTYVLPGLEAAMPVDRIVAQQGPGDVRRSRRTDGEGRHSDPLQLVPDRHEGHASTEWHVAQDVYHGKIDSVRQVSGN